MKTFNSISDFDTFLISKGKDLEFFEKEMQTFELSGEVYNINAASKDIVVYMSEDEENEKIHKVFFGNSVQIRFNYWYQCNYEYDEWQENSVVTLAKQIKFKSIY